MNGYKLGVPTSDLIEIFAPGGQLCLSIRLDPGGPLVELKAQSLRVAASDVSVDCDTFDIHARKDIILVAAGTIAQDARGDIVLRSDGEFATEAAGQQHHARLGSIDIRANDDVAIDGERVRLNSPRAFELPPVDLHSRQLKDTPIGPVDSDVSRTPRSHPVAGSRPPPDRLRTRE